MSGDIIRVNPNEQRIAMLEQMLSARSDSAGNPRKGYKSNVQAIKTELALLRAQE